MALRPLSLGSLKLTMPTLQSLVSTNPKQRFSLIPDPAIPEAEFDPSNPAHHLIRANQGHTLTIADASSLLIPLTPLPPRHPVVHGTTWRAWGLIARSGGLKTMGRTHVHFARGLPDGWRAEGDASTSAKKGISPAGVSSDAVNLGLGQDGVEPVDDDGPLKVISGMRMSSQSAIYIDVGKAMEDYGLKEWWVSENGVVPCDGGEDGLVPVQCFERVEDRKGNVIMRGGVLVEGEESRLE